jgi:putative NADPH-quinone reductase
VRALVVHAHPPDAPGVDGLAAAAIAGLRRGGHEVRAHDLVAEGFSAVLTTDERVAYHGEHPILDPRVAEHAADVAWAQAIVLVYPTTWVGMPPVLKAWLERVLVPGVGFVLRDDRVRPGLRHVRRLVGVTTYDGGRLTVALAGDGGRRTVTRALRMLCARSCRTRWLASYRTAAASPSRRASFVAHVEQALARL